MAVGFSDVSQFPGFEATTNDYAHDRPLVPWALQFCRVHGFGNEQGAHDVDTGKGANIIIAHPDTGYTEHPEIMHGQPSPRTFGACTFTDPVPSYQTYAQGSLQFWRNYEIKPNVRIPVLVYDPKNGLQMQQGGASLRVGWPNDGKDTLAGLFPMNPSHGTGTASRIMSADGAPTGQWAAGYPSRPDNEPNPPATPINGVAPGARLMPIRVADTVIIDPIVSNNLAQGLLHAASEAMTNDEIGVVSISMGWPGGTRYQNYAALANALDEATKAGLIVCAAAAQSGVAFAPAIEDFGDFVDDAFGAPVDDAAGLASEAQLAARLTVMMAQTTRLALTPQSTLDGLIAEVVNKAEAAGRTAAQIEGYLKTLSGYIRALSASIDSAAGYIKGLVGYPGTDPNTICCAACDFRGDPMKDGFYGPEVDITAPGQDVFNAKAVLGDNGNHYYTQQTSGTSYATAITAGICALWQSKWSRTGLISVYGRGLMVHAFRLMLKKTAATSTLERPNMTWAPGRGFGMIDAHRLLTTAPPSSADALIAELRAEGLADKATLELLERRKGTGVMA